MSNDLQDFEKALQNRYSSEIELLHSHRIQQIVDYYSFSLDEVWKFIKGPVMFGPKTGFMRNGITFDQNVWTMETFLELDGIKKFSYFYCSTVCSIRYIMIFPRGAENTYFKDIRRLENLRMFL